MNPVQPQFSAVYANLTPEQEERKFKGLCRSHDFQILKVVNWKTAREKGIPLPVTEGDRFTILTDVDVDKFNGLEKDLEHLKEDNDEGGISPSMVTGWHNTVDAIKRLLEG